MRQKKNQFPNVRFYKSIQKWNPKDVHFGAFFANTIYMRKVVSRTLKAAKMEQKVTPAFHISRIFTYVGRLFGRISDFCGKESQRSLQPNTMSQTQENTMGKLMQECLPCILHCRMCLRKLSAPLPCKSLLEPVCRSACKADLRSHLGCSRLSQCCFVYCSMSTFHAGVQV